MNGSNQLARLAAVAVLVCASLAVVGCGGGSDSSSKGEIEAARKAGEESARERDRLNNLRKEVHALKHQVRHGAHTVVVERRPSSSPPAAESQDEEVLRVFHAPSGNVSCEILSMGALCTVASTETTFRFSGDGAAQTEAGAALSRGSGELAPYGSTVSEGTISCSIPNSSEPRGVTCSNGETGHGFEASRISARQRVY